MANSADPDQLASSEANWSGSTLFAKAGYIRVQLFIEYKFWLIQIDHTSTPPLQLAYIYKT